MTRFQVWPDAWPQSHPDGWPEGPVRLNNVLVPLGSVGLEVVKNPGGARSGDREGFMRTSLTIREGRIAEPMGDETALDCAGALVMPGFVDCHTHLDKGHIWRRTPNPDGTFDGALNAVAGDREKCWSGEDVAARMAFSLEAAHAHGTVAIRTHLDSGDARSESTWEVFAQARETWAGRVALQGAALTTLEDVFSDDFERLADLVATHEGVLGAVTYPLPDMPARLDRFFKLAADRGLNADFHADESLNPESETLREIAEARLRNNFEGRVLAGHCCSLAILPEDQADRTMDLVAEAGIDIVSLPLCNLYLQDRVPGRTPRYRGVTLVHELVARGVNVSFASDNTRDPFYAYGDLDMVEVLREATRIAHLDHPVGDWPASFAANPARAMGLTGGTLTPGAPADFVIFPAARGWTELNARPQSDRVVIRGGRPLGTAAPAYDRLDPVVIEGSAHTAVAPDIAGAKAALAHLDLDDHPKTVLQKSRDFYWYSPVLKAKLEGVTADFVIAPRSVDEVVEVMRVAYAHNVPVTTRGSGTGNYGQAMPLSGGIVLHMKHMTKILELEHGRILAEAGIVLADLDRETREKTNQELRIHPSTHGT
ncbi:MAG: cytosine deaminase, partial [Pseudomonadota bacterium]